MSAFESRLRDALAREPAKRLTGHDWREAAVLILLFERDGEPWAIFTRRTDHVRHHKGQISFPGGARDAGDPDLLATALRETQEEIGVDPERIRLLGALDDIPTYVTGFVITPAVGALDEPLALAPDPREVAEVIELPLRAVAAAEREEEWEQDGVRFPMYFYDVGAHTIWGATGRILHDFLEQAAPALTGEEP